MSAVLEPTRTRCHSFHRPRTPTHEDPITPPLTPSTSLPEITGLAELLSSSLLRVPSTDLHETSSKPPGPAYARPGTQSSPRTNKLITEVRCSPTDPVVDCDGGAAIRQAASQQPCFPTIGEPAFEPSEGGIEDADVHCGIVTSKVCIPAGNPVAATVNPESTSAQRASGIIVVEIGSPYIDCWDKKSYLSSRKSRGKFYVGKARHFPCPDSLKIGWEREVRPRLLQDLSSVLSWSSSSELFEVELRMAGHTKNATSIELRSTVCIRCTSKKCRKRFEKAVQDLDYLQSFSRGLVEVRLGAPKLASSSTNDPLSSSPVITYGHIHEEAEWFNSKWTLHVRYPISERSACGATLMAREIGDAEEKRISKIGGLIKAGDKIYGLTTAHGLIRLSNHAQYSAAAVTGLPKSERSSSSDAETESSYDSNTSADTSCQRGSEMASKGYCSENSQPDEHSVAAFVKQSQQLNTKGVSCELMNFCGRRSAKSNLLDIQTPCEDGDFALIDMGFSSTYQLSNEFMNQANSGFNVDGHKREEDVRSGEVSLLLSPQKVIVGHLLEDCSYFMNNSVLFKTRKVELEKPLPTGTSGTWVVQGGALCGIVLAIYEDDPSAHIITADKMFQDISNIQPDAPQFHNIQVATKDDIARIYTEPLNTDPNSLYGGSMQYPAVLGVNGLILREDATREAIRPSHTTTVGTETTIENSDRSAKSYKSWLNEFKERLKGFSHRFRTHSLIRDAKAFEEAHSSEITEDFPCHPQLPSRQSSPMRLSQRKKGKRFRKNHDFRSQHVDHDSDEGSQLDHPPFGLSYSFRSSDDCGIERPFPATIDSLSFWVNLAICIFSTLLCVMIWTVTFSPTFQHRYFAIESGLWTVGSATMMTAALVKLAEISFIASVAILVGQILSRRAFENGVSLAELNTWCWVMQPGLALTGWQSVRHVIASRSGVTTLILIILTTSYGPVANLLVRPTLMYSDWENTTLEGMVETDFATAGYLAKDCKDPFGDQDLEGVITCLQVDYVAQAYHVLRRYLDLWGERPTNETEPFYQGKKSAPMLSNFDGMTITPQWINAADNILTSLDQGRFTNKVSLAMPHSGVAQAVRDTGHGLQYPAALDHAQSYSIHASVPSLATHVLCANMHEHELTPIVYDRWNDASTNPPAWNQTLQGGLYTENDTIVDALFDWTKSDAELRDYPPVFAKLPQPLHTVISRNRRNALYILGQGGPHAGFDSTGLYVLCSMNVSVTLDCSTRYSARNLWSSIEAHCEDPYDNMMYANTTSGQIGRPIPSWFDIGLDWADSLSLDSTLNNGNDALQKSLMRLIDDEKSHLGPNNKWPSVSKALAVISSPTLLKSMQGAPFDNLDRYSLFGSLPQKQTFSAEFQAQYYMWGAVQGPANIACFFILSLVFSTNLFILMYLTTRRRQLVTDITEPPNLFALALNSPPSHVLRGSGGNAPRGDQLGVKWVINSKNVQGYMEPRRRKRSRSARKGGGFFSRATGYQHLTRNGYSALSRETEEDSDIEMEPRKYAKPMRRRDRLDIGEH